MANSTLDGALATGGGRWDALSARPVMAKSGYAGQLYEVTILAITGTPGPSVAEGGTLQLSAMAVLDDATQLAPAPGSVVWSVATGPLTGIDAAGLASAGQLGRTTRPARRPLGAGSPVNSR